MARRPQTIAADLLPEPPDDPSELEPDSEEPSDGSDLEYEELPCTDDGDESRWEAFIPDDDEFDPEPDAGDFWIGNPSPADDAAANAGIPAWC